MTDLAMPVMSGIELIRAVRKLYPSIAIAVLTLHQDFEYIQEARAWVPLITLPR